MPAGYELCRSHHTLERLDDLIDFPVSDSFLGYYHERGLTYRRPTVQRGPDQAQEIVRLLTDLLDARQEPPPDVPRQRPRTPPVERPPLAAKRGFTDG